MRSEPVQHGHCQEQMGDLAVFISDHAHSLVLHRERHVAPARKNETPVVLANKPATVTIQGIGCPSFVIFFPMKAPSHSGHGSQDAQLAGLKVQGVVCMQTLI